MESQTLMEQEKAINDESAIESKFTKSAGGINDGLNGAFYQVRLLMLFAFRARKRNLSFQLGTEIKEAGKFDDLIFKYTSSECPNNFCFLQAKFKKNAKKIGLETLLVDNNYKLAKYYRSFRELRRTVALDDIQEVVICTNNTFDFTDFQPTDNIFKLQRLRNESVYFEKIMDDHPIFGDYEHRFKFVSENFKEHREATKTVLLSYFENYNNVASELAELVVTGSTKESPYYLKKYSRHLRCFVVDQSRGKFRDGFVSGDDPNLQQLRGAFELLFKRTMNVSATILDKDLRNKLKIDFWKHLSRVPVDFSVVDGGADCDGAINDISSEALGPTISDIEISEFLDKLVFVMKLTDDNIQTIMKDIKQPSLSNKISDMQDMTQDFNITNIDMILNEFEREILEWIKNSKKVFLDDKDVEEIFQSVKKRVYKLHLVALQNEILDELSSSQMSFHTKFEELENFVVSKNHQIFLMKIPHDEFLVQQIKMIQTIQEHQKWMLLTKSSLSLKNLNLIVETFKEPQYKILIYECKDASSNDNLSKIFEVLKIEADKKLILFSSFPDTEKFLINNFSDSRKISTIQLKCPLVHELDRESLEKLLAQQVNFQGVSVPLNQLLETPEIIQNQPLKIFQELTNKKIGSNIFDNEKRMSRSDIPTKGYKQSLYMDRQVCCPHRVRPEILTDKREKRIFDELVFDQSQFLEMKDKFPMKNINWIEVMGESARRRRDGDPTEESQEPKLELEWKKSHGNTEEIEKYIYTLTLNENDLINQKSTRATVIADQAGMGKSTLTDSLSMKLKTQFPDCWITRINLIDTSNELEKLSRQLKANQKFQEIQILSFLSKVNGIKDQVEKLVFERLFQNRQRFCVIFDGFDEICPYYEDTVISLIHFFQENHYENIFVTSRPENCQKLEESLKVRVFSMVPLTQEHQKDYLLKYWKSKYSFNDDILDTFAKNILDGIYVSLNDSKNVFIGNPLILSMIADVFEKDLKSIESAAVTIDDWISNIQEFTPNITYLFENFVKLKYSVYFTDKFQVPVNNAYVKMIHQKLEKEFNWQHTTLALKSMFSAEDFESFQLTSPQEEDESIFKCGIVYKIENSVRFIHKTFAEYFVSRFFLENLKKYSKFIIEKILVDNEFKMIRVFINCELEKSKESLEKLGFLPMEAQGNDVTSLHIAAKERDAKTVNFLLDSLLREDKQKCQEILLLADNTNGFLVIHYYLQFCSDDFTFLQKIKSGLGLEFLWQLLMTSNKESEHSLFFANRGGKLLLLLKWLECWADKNKLESLLLHRNAYGYNVLRYILSGYLSAAEIQTRTWQLFEWIHRVFGATIWPSLLFLHNQNQFNLLHNFVLSSGSKKEFPTMFTELLKFLVSKMKLKPQLLKDLVLSEDSHQMNVLHLFVFECPHVELIAATVLKIIDTLRRQFTFDEIYAFSLFTTSAYDGASLIKRLADKCPDFQDFVCELQLLLGKEFDLSFVENME